MSGVTSIKQMCEAEFEGRTRYTEWSKRVTIVTTAGFWYDLTTASGTPPAKQWFDATPLVAQQVKQSTDGGIYHGGPVSAAGFEKFLRMMRVSCVTVTPLPLTVMLCDYLLYYPTVDEGTTDTQVMTNNVTLPRYTTGAGVQMIAVTISSRTGGQSFTVNYTNQDGVAGRVSVAAIQNAAVAPGTIATASLTTQSGGNPFITLQQGDTGVRSIESVTMAGEDTGFFALVLVRPLATIMVRDIDTPYEKDFMLLANEMPEIQDDAYLSVLALPSGSMGNVTLRGGFRSIWN